MKKVLKFCIALVCIIVSVIWGLAVYKINKTFPDAKEYEYNSENICEYNGIEFIPSKCEIISVSEYEEKYKDNKYAELAENNHNLDLKVIVLTIRLKNVSEKSLKVAPYLSMVYHEKSGWTNGCTVISEEEIKLLLNPGESSTIKLTTSVLEVNMKKRFFDNLKPEDISILIQTYPDRIKIDF